MKSNVIEIEEKIKSKNNKHIAFSAFSALGLSAMYITADNSNYQLASSLGAAIAGSTLFASVVDKAKLLNRSKSFITFSLFKKPYQKLLEQWLPTYLDSAKSPIEKKYRLLLSAIYLNDKGADMHAKGIKDVIVSNSDKLYEQKTTQYHLSDIYYESLSDLTHYNVLKEDENDEIKLNIARSVMSEFSTVGLLGKQMAYFSGGPCEFLFNLQNEKLTLADKEALKKISTNLEQYITDSGMRNFQFVKEYTISSLDSLITNENEPESLKLYKTFFSSLYAKSSLLLEYTNNLIERKINYLALNSSTSDIKDVKSSTNKRNKI